MSATNQFEVDLLALLFTNTTATNIGDGTGIAGGTVGAVDVSLHTTTLTDASVNNTTGWTVSAGGDPTTCTNAALITYVTATGGSETETDFGICLASGTYLQIYGALSAGLAVSTGITPEFAIGALDIRVA